MKLSDFVFSLKDEEIKTALFKFTKYIVDESVGITYIKREIFKFKDVVHVFKIDNQLITEFRWYNTKEEVVDHFFYIYCEELKKNGKLNK